MQQPQSPNEHKNFSPDACKALLSPPPPSFLFHYSPSTVKSHQKTVWHSNALVCAINWHILHSARAREGEVECKRGYTKALRCGGETGVQANEFCVCQCECIMHRMHIRMKILLHLMATRKRQRQLHQQSVDCLARCAPLSASLSASLSFPLYLSPPLSHPASYYFVRNSLFYRKNS